MDYDATNLAAGYDRGRDHGPQVLNLWMNVVSSYVKDQHIETVLDLGCGTGRFSEALAICLDAQVVGLDPPYVDFFPQSRPILEQCLGARASIRECLREQVFDVFVFRS